MQNIENKFEILHQNDLLLRFRDKFHLPKNCIYFCGNSLGLQPISLSNYIKRELDDWANLGVEAHFKTINPWYDYHKIVAPSLCELTGALPNEIVAMNSLTVNLHLLLLSFYNPTKERFKILIEAPTFSSDYYAIESQIKMHDFLPKDSIIEVKPKENSYHIDTETLIGTIEKNASNLSLVLLGGVNYYSGQLFDLQLISKICQKHSIYFGLDLAHAIGNIPLHLHDWNIDFATWCSYKYLNSGPGGVSGIFIHQNHHKRTDFTRFEGWWGNDENDRFKMNKKFNPQEGAGAWQLSNPNILGLTALKASLDIFNEAGIENLRAKSKIMSGLLIEGINKLNIEGLKIITPFNENERGCQISILMEKNGKNLFNYLTKKGIIADWREPNVIRIAPVPLYNTFLEIGEFLTILAAYNHQT